MVRIHSNMLGYAVVTPNTFTQTWSTTPTAPATTSSFVGGGLLTISGVGFITSFPQSNEVTVCGILAPTVSATQS